MGGSCVAPLRSQRRDIVLIHDPERTGGRLGRAGIRRCRRGAAQTELEAVHADVAAPESPRLENMSIDELRALAASLAIPNRGSITEQDQLIAAIRQRL